MRRWMYNLLFVALIAATVPASALSPGTDVLVPAAARAGTWVTDLYVLNTGDQSASVTIYWMIRDQANSSPASEAFTLGPGKALDLPDVILNTFGLSEGAGAFRVISDQTVVVNSRIYNLQGSVTFGQGFEGVPRNAAVTAGGTTDVVGLANNTNFRTNVVLMDASGSNSNVSLTLYDAAGTQIATRDYALDAFEPKLKNLTSVFSGLSADIDYATLHAEVNRGSVIVVASKVDNDVNTGDPTTLEAWTSSCGEQDGRYEVLLYDSYEYATGGYMEVENGQVDFLKASYMNWDKGDPEDPDCTLVFLFGGPGLDVHSLDDYADGVTFTQSFTDSGTLTFTIEFDLINNMTVSGTVDAVGTDFTGDEDGCNGTFPQMILRGGKSSN